MFDTRNALLAMLIGIVATGTANAGTVLVGNPADGVQAADEISVSTTWTANNTYNLQDQIYVKPGATLTIEAGTVIASSPSANGKAGLAITRGGKIMALGTQDNPIIFTSLNDVATWTPDAGHPTGGDPTTGNWRAAAREWGNLTVMGRGFISEDATPGNQPTCNPNNFAVMEGLIAEGADDPNVRYGGGDDNDDSGTIQYVSLRYGGRVAALTVELNGLSLGGIGRATDIDHIEIMNNVDDGIEIWGGTVNLSHISIWNVGDDSFDFDQGWRGKAQFGLIVQGYSLDAAQGSGVGDNLFETDGAEQSHWQPVTTATIYNFTAIGQPIPGAGDHGTAWRDNARVQYRNCIFMDLGDRFVSFDNIDGDGGLGYGHMGTLSWPATWTTPYTSTSAINPCPSPATTYTAQSAGSAAIGQGFLAEITDSVLWRNLGAAAYTESDARGVTIAGGSNPAKGIVVSPYIPATPTVNMPIAGLTRQLPPVSLQGGTFMMVPVISIDPRAANAAAASIAAAPSDGFFTPAMYRGGFGPDDNWICGWTAAAAYGYVVDPPGGCNPPPPDCPSDIDGEGDVDGVDLGTMLANWSIPAGSPGCSGALPCPSDIDGDGDVDGVDLGTLLANWSIPAGSPGCS